MGNHVVVVGGGFAGAAAATRLAETGVTVTLLEQKATLGGRASSFRDGVTKDEVDNGQHLFLGCYRETRRFLSRLKVGDRLRFPPSLRIPFLSPGGRRAELGVSGALLPALARFKALSWGDRFSLLRGMASVRWGRGLDLSRLTVSQWLDRLRQTPGARRAFWRPLCLATLNAAPEEACAEALAVVLREGFLGRASDRALGYASVSLAKLWPVELPAYLKSRGGVAAMGQTVTGFEVRDGRVHHVHLDSGETGETDAVVCAAPLTSFLEICPPEIRAGYDGLEAVSHSPILSVNLWFPRAPFDEPFLGLLDAETQWAFNRDVLWAGRGASKGYVSLVLSGASAHERKTSDEIVRMALEDLRRCLPGFDQEPRHAAVVWEKRATPLPTPAFWRSRPRARTPLENFFLAGDWVDSGLPPTIEAACRSGHRAADLVKAYLERKESHAESRAV